MPPPLVGAIATSEIYREKKEIYREKKEIYSIQREEGEKMESSCNTLSLISFNCLPFSLPFSLALLSLALLSQFSL